MMTKKSLCSFWLKGKCQRGTKCRYAHGEAEIGTMAPTCHEFENGACRRGDACKFSHDIMPQEGNLRRRVDLKANPNPKRGKATADKAKGGSAPSRKRKASGEDSDSDVDNEASDDDGKAVDAYDNSSHDSDEAASDFPQLEVQEFLQELADNWGNLRRSMETLYAKQTPELKATFAFALRIFCRCRRTLRGFRGLGARIKSK